MRTASELSYAQKNVLYEFCSTCLRFKRSNSLNHCYPSNPLWFSDVVTDSLRDLSWILGEPPRLSS